MKKVILFTRVSTKEQSCERQKDLLLPLIKSDGYSDEEIAIIEHKESAIKNDVQNRKSISEMETLINSESIECVYVTEISRLGRRNDVLYYIFNLLEQKHIALVVQSPSLIRTINKDGSANPMGQLVISFMQHLAVSEMKIKQERQKSGIERKKKNGHITSAKVLFGYKRSKDNRPIIDEANAEIARKMFNDYLNGDSVGIIADRLKYLLDLNKEKLERRIYNILVNKAYIGEHPIFPYPPIIDKETFNGVQKKLKDKTTRATYKSDFPYYCRKLITFQDRTLSPVRPKGVYLVCIGSKTYSININCIDGLTKELAMTAYSIMSERDAHKEKESLLEAKETALKKIDGIDKEIAAMETKLSRLNDTYIDGRIDKDKYEFSYKKFKEEAEFLIKEKNELNLTISSINDILKGEVTATKTYLNLDKVDDNEIIGIINKVISKIELEETEYGWNIRYVYKDAAYNEENKDVYYRYIRKGRKICLYECTEDTMTDFTGCWGKHI